MLFLVIIPHAPSDDAAILPAAAPTALALGAAVLGIQHAVVRAAHRLLAERFWRLLRCARNLRVAKPRICVALAEEGLTAMFPQRFDVPLPVPLPRCTFTQGEDDACQTHADAECRKDFPFSQFRHIR
jgi:hypothetical protein